MKINNTMSILSIKDSNGYPVRGWTFGTFKAIQVGVGIRKSRKIFGWIIRSDDGQERYCEGNWQQFVPFARQIVSNYGFTTNLT